MLKQNRQSDMPKTRRIQSAIIAGALLALFAAMPAAALEAVDYYRQGLQSFEQGDVESLRASVGYFRRAIEANPYYFHAWRDLGIAYHKLGYYPLAKTAFEKALSNLPDHIEANMAYAETLIALGENKEARAFIDRILRAEPRNVQALYLDAVWWHKERRDDLAQTRLQSVLALDPLHISGLILRGKIFEEAKQYRQAEESLRAATQAQPHHARAHYALGNFLFEQGRVREAGDELGLALSLNDELHEARLPWARTQYVLRNYAAAADSLERLVALYPDEVLYRYLLAEANAREAENESRRESAAANFKAALRLRNNDEVIRYAFEDFAVAHLSIRNADRQALARYHIELGDFHFDRNNDYQAEVSYRRAIRLDPYSVPARGRFARIARKQERHERYYEYLKLLADLDKGNAKLANNLEYSASIVARLPSRQRGVEQYDVMLQNSVPIIAVSDHFEAYDIRHGYYGVDGVLASLLRDALRPLTGLRLLDTDKTRAPDLTTARRQALAVGADYFVHGKYVLDNLALRMEVSLRHTASGEALTNWIVSKRGNHALYEASCDAAKRLAGALPLVGRIARIRGTEVMIDLGSMHGVAKGSVFQVFTSPNFRAQVLANLGRDALPKPIGEITISAVDEAVSFGEITARETFNGITTYQYVLMKKPEKTE
jgi:tetratricopeptide (TPR) repeat protein